MIKKTIAALALSLSAGAAMAETGIINFHGTVSTGGTCPIDVVTPGGPALPRVHLGDFRTKDFTTVGQKTPAVHFGLRVTPDATCVIDPAHKAYVTFSPRFGADPSGKLYSLQSGVGYLLVPYLRPYRNNTLILDTDDLGPDALIETGTLQLVPLRGAIVKATFAARKVTRLVLTLMQADGRPLPFGATVKDEQGQTLAVVGQAGQALVAIDASEQALRVDWHDQRPQQCAFDIDVAHMRQDGGYHLQTLHCQPR